MAVNRFWAIILPTFGGSGILAEGRQEPGTSGGWLWVESVLNDSLVAEFIHRPQKVYTFSFIVSSIFPKSVKCIPQLLR